jgi:hypothetical protein
MPAVYHSWCLTMNHDVIKFIRNTKSDFKCADCNASYPTMRSLSESHVGMTVTITVIDKRDQSDMYNKIIQVMEKRTPSQLDMLAKVHEKDMEGMNYG